MADPSLPLQRRHRKRLSKRIISLDERRLPHPEREARLLTLHSSIQPDLVEAARALIRHAPTLRDKEIRS